MPAPAYDPYAQQVHAQTLTSYAQAASPKSVARVVFKAATSRSTQPRFLAGSQPKLVYLLRWLLPRGVFAALINRTNGGSQAAVAQHSEGNAAGAGIVAT